MKKHISIFGLFLCGVLLTGSFFYAVARGGDAAISRKEGDGNEGISFLENQWGKAMQKAAAEHKYIFLDAYATWCGPCKLLTRTTFRDKNVAAFFNEHFVSVSMDVEKGEGAELASKWGIRAMPTLLFLDSAGEPVVRSIGYLGAEELLALGKQALGKDGKQQK